MFASKPSSASKAAPHPRDELVTLSAEFLASIQNLTANSETEAWLNATHGPGTPVYDRLAELVKQGVADGWAAHLEVEGPRYRRSRIHEPDARLQHFSITAVYMDSTDNTQGNPEGSLRGQYHAHPYGEFNMVVPLSAQAAIAGPNGWCHAGWTAPPPGSHHYPEVKGGALIALFFLPAGRISYEIEAPALAA